MILLIVGIGFERCDMQEFHLLMSDFTDGIANDELD